MFASAFSRRRLLHTASIQQSAAQICLTYHAFKRQRLFSDDATHPSIIGTLPEGGKGVAVAQYAEVRARVTSTTEQVMQFGKLVGDLNVLHSPQTSLAEHLVKLEDAGLIRWRDDTQEKTSEALVHGMMVSSLFSCIFGTLIPGSVYRSQDLLFRVPVFANDEVTARVEVTKVRSWRHGVVLMCDTTVMCKGRECITGQASVWLPGGEARENNGTR